MSMESDIDDLQLLRKIKELDPSFRLATQTKKRLFKKVSDLEKPTEEIVVKKIMSNDSKKMYEENQELKKMMLETRQLLHDYIESNKERSVFARGDILTYARWNIEFSSSKLLTFFIFKCCK